MPGSPQARPLAAIVAGALALAAGLALAHDRLPEWRAPRRSLAPAAVFADRYRALAQVAGIELAPGEPRVSLVIPGDVWHRDCEILGDRAPGWLAESDTALEVEVAERARRRDGREGKLALRFSPDGSPWYAEWSALDFGAALLFLTPSMPTPSGEEDLVRLLARPGEIVARREVRLGGTASFVFFSLTTPRQHLELSPASWTSAAGRMPASVAESIGFFERFNWGQTLTIGLRWLLLRFGVVALFFALILRRRIDLRNGALLAGFALAASLPAAEGMVDGSWRAFQVLFGLLGSGLGIFLLWSTGESLLRFASADFTTSLDSLRVGRLGRRGGRALLAGLGFGAGLAGLRLAAASLATLLPGAWPTAPSFALPVWSADGNPVGQGFQLAATIVLLLALALRVLPRRWAALATILAAGLVTEPVAVHPFALHAAAGLAVAAILVYVGRRFGLTALLTAATTAFLLPAAAFSALHLGWLPGAFAATAGVSAGILVLGLLGLGRPERVEMERVAPPPFIRRLEEERRVQYEMELLTRMQLGLLPDGVPQLSGWDIAARSILATEAGGDLYDFLNDSPAGDGQLWIAAGDVAGHGYSCAIVHAMTTAALASLIAPGRTPSEVLRQVDRVIRRGGTHRNFTSLALLRLDPRSGEVLFANAGHPYPLLLADGVVREIALPGLPLGQGPDRDYQDLALTLPPGSILVLCSDGLFEAADWSGAAYGFEPVRTP